MKLFDRFVLPQNVHEKLQNVATTCEMLDLETRTSILINKDRIYQIFEISNSEPLLSFSIEYESSFNHEEELELRGTTLSKVRNDDWEDVFGWMTLENGIRRLMVELSLIKDKEV